MLLKKCSQIHSIGSVVSISILISKVNGGDVKMRTLFLKAAEATMVPEHEANHGSRRNKELMIV